MLLDLNLAEPAPRAAMAYDPQNFRPHGLSCSRRPQACATVRRLASAGWQPHGGNRRAGARRCILSEGDGAQPRLRASECDCRHGCRGSSIWPTTRSTRASGRLAKQVLFRRGPLDAGVLRRRGGARRSRRPQFPAGLALSPDGSRLYVGEALAQAAAHLSSRCCARRADARGVRDRCARRRTISTSMPMACVWIAAHPKLLSLAAHLRDPRKRAPTQVLRFDPRGAKPVDGATDPASPGVRE